jgi:glycosyltransferase involved in cell wall biosynthesis
MKVLLITLWKPAKGGVVTHVANLIKNSRHDFIIQSYPRFVNLPLLRAFSFVAVGFARRLTSGYDVMHAHYALPQGLLGVLLKKVRGKPLVVTIHGSDVSVLAKNPLAAPIVLFVLNNSDRVITVSDYLKDEVTKLGIDPEKVSVVYGGTGDVSTEKEDFDFDGTIITFIGNLVKQKGVDVLLEAFKDVPDAKLVIVGDGKEGPALKKLAKDQEDVYFVGYREDLASVFEKTRLLVLPSRSEGFGLVLLEAMKAGVPVVASRVGGIAEVVEDSRNGILVEPENPKQLADAITMVLEDEELRENLIRNGHETSEKFSWRSMSSAIDKIYEELA